MSKQLTKKAGAGMFAALALAVALAILAFGTYQPVGAQTVSSNVSRSFSAAQVVAGGTVDVTITFAGGPLDVISVTETLPSGWSYQSVVSPSDLVVTVSGQSITFEMLGGEIVTYQVMAPSTAGSGTFSGTVAEQAGASVGGDATVTVIPEGTTPEVPDAVELSSNNAGADVSIDISAMADDSIRGGTDIDVTLEGFGIPSSIDDSDVILDGGAGSYYGNPEDVSVSGSTITITLPTRVSGTNEEAVISGSYSIRFKSSAGLSNPTSAGDKEITVSDADADDETSTVTIVKTASVSPTFVARGGDATVTAKGLRDGTTTVYLVDADGDRGSALGSGNADGGSVEIAINTSGLVAGATADGSSDVGENTLRVIDSNDDQVGGDFMLGIKPTVKLGSATAKRSADLSISVSDWYYGDIDRVTVAGISVGDVDVSVGSDMKETFTVTVPGNVRTGDQEVKVYGDDSDLNTTSATAMVNIVVLPLSVSPSTVVPGHRVTITGSGFAKNTDVDSISIGGVDVDVPEDADSTSSGRVAVTVIVPMTVGDGDKAVKLTVATRTGEGEITVPEPEIELSPSESVPGSVISVYGHRLCRRLAGRSAIRWRHRGSRPG